MSLFGLWTLNGLPWPILVGVGIALAIASNRTLRIRRRVQPSSPAHYPSGKTVQTAEGDRLQETSSSEALSNEPQLPTFTRPPSPQRSHSISFKIESPSKE